MKLKRIAAVISILFFFNAQNDYRITPEDIGYSAISDEFVLNPVDLLTPSRFDITAKYLYAYYKNKNQSLQWVQNLYKDHLKAINGLCEQYSPYKPPLKKGLSEFLTAFHETIEGIVKNGFDNNESFIPLDAQGCLRDGAHRVAACILFGITPICKIYNYPPCQFNFDAQFFKQRGLSEAQLDAMALTYCKLKKNTFIIMVLPTKTGKNQEIINLVKQHSTVVYQKEILLNDRNVNNFISYTYKNKPWHKGFSSFLPEKNDNQMHIFLIEAKNIETVIECRKTIETIFDIDSYIIFSTKNRSQTVAMARILFIQNNKQKSQDD